MVLCESGSCAELTMHSGVLSVNGRSEFPYMGGLWQQGLVHFTLFTRLGLVYMQATLLLEPHG